MKCVLHPDTLSTHALIPPQKIFQRRVRVEGHVSRRFIESAARDAPRSEVKTFDTSASVLRIASRKVTRTSSNGG